MREKLVSSTVELNLTCKKCGLRANIRTNHLEQYTPEVRGNWVCAGCSYKNGKKREVKSLKGAEVEQNKKEEQMASEHDGIQLSEDDAKSLVIKFKMPANWKNELLVRYAAGAKTVGQFLVEVDSIIDTKVRLKGNVAEDAIAKRKEECRQKARKVIEKHFKISLSPTPIPTQEETK